MLDYYISWDFAITSENFGGCTLAFHIWRVSGIGQGNVTDRRIFSKALHLDDKVADRFRVDNKNLIF